MQTVSSSNSPNTVSAIAAVMLEHPGKSDIEIRQIGCFSRRQWDAFAPAAAELAAQKSERRI